jgi:hypothetical protein
MASYLILEGSVTVAYDGKIVSVSEADHRYQDLIAALKDDRHEDIPEILDVSNIFKGSDDLSVVEGVIHIRGRKIPDVLNKRIMSFKKQGLPYEPIVKFTDKLMRNPSLNSRNMLYSFLEHNGHPLTKDGNFIAYKKIRINFTDCHTGKFDNSIGNTLSMPREDVDDNPNNTCSQGLHVAAYQYANDFSAGHLVEVEVNPEHVVAVPNDYNGQKMRVCEYTVKAICETILESDLYEDDYDDCDDYDEIDNYFDEIPF